MEVTIGIAKTEREIIIDTDKTLEELTDLFQNTTAENILVLDDTKGERFLIARNRISYVHIGKRRTKTVGFAN